MIPALELTQALLGLAPLPSVTLAGLEPGEPLVTYYRQPTGSWVWHHAASPARGLTCFAPTGSRIATKLDAILLTATMETPDHA